MDQPSLFTVPPVSVTPIPRERTSAETRRRGHEQSAVRSETLLAKMLHFYRLCSLTDAQMAVLLGVERTTVTARRDELIKAGKVQSMRESRKNPKTGVPNLLWGLVHGADPALSGDKEAAVRVPQAGAR